MQIAICDDEKSIGLILEEKIKKLLPDAVILNSSKLLICDSTLNHICDSTSDNRLLILIEKLHTLLG